MGFQVASRFADELLRVDHQGILKNAHLASLPLDKYLVVRSCFVLGRYAEAQKWLEQYDADLKKHPFLRVFLLLQLNLYRREQLGEVALSFARLAGQLPSDPYLQAEYHYIFGFLHNLMDEYRVGSRHHQLAADFYRSINLPGFECQAIFNLCVSLNHLNDRQGFELAFKRIAEVAAQFPISTTQLFYKRLRVYKKVDAEDFAGALRDTDCILGLCETEGRLRDLGGMFFLKSYLLCKLKQAKKWEELQKKIDDKLMSLTPEHRAAIGELRALNALGEVTSSVAQTCIQRWSRERLPSIHHLFLFGILIDRIALSSDAELLVKISHQANQFALAHQQALNLMDFRRHEVEGYIRLGKLKRAAMLLSAYRNDAAKERSVAKLAYSRDLECLLDAARSKQAGEVTQETTRGAVLLIDPSGHVMTYRGRTISLKDSPLVGTLLKTLVEVRKPLSIPDLFEMIYRLPFNAFLHQSRFNSLLDRARNLLGDSSVVHRSEGRICLDPQVESRLEVHSVPDHLVLNRRDLLIKVIGKTGGTVSISELEGHFDCTRRTLQLDLKYLVTKRVLHCTGGTKKRRYAVEVP